MKQKYMYSMNNNNVASSTPPVCSKIVLCGTLYVIKTTQLEDEKNRYHTVGTIPKSNLKVVERGTIDSHKAYALPLTFLSWYRDFNT
jgi:hypothetical protein